MGEQEEVKWYAMRDLRRQNAKIKAYQELKENGFEVFTPMHWVVTTIGGKKQRRQVPVISDMLFVRSGRSDLDKVVAVTDTLQYRYIKGMQATPITVRDQEMNDFVRACNAVAEVRYYLPEEITGDMIGKSVRIIGGTLDGLEGRLLKMRGSRKKRLLVQLPGLLSAAIEVTPTLIHPINE